MDFSKELSQIKQSPVVSLDFETDGLIPYEAKPEGVSVGWKKEGKVHAQYWTLDCSGKNKVSWQWFNETILNSIWEDAEKTLVFHNAKFDLQVAMRRRAPYPLRVSEIWKRWPKCRVDDTMIMSFLVDENRPRSLKDLSRILLKKPRATYEQTQAKINGIYRKAENVIDEFVRQGWIIYSSFRKPCAGELFPSEHAEMISAYPLLSKKDFDKKLTADSGESSPADWAYYVSLHHKPQTHFEEMIHRMREGLKKEEFSQELSSLISPKIKAHHQVEAERMMWSYGKEDASDTLRIYDILSPLLGKAERKWYDEVELPFALLMVVMEIGGMTVDVSLLEAMERDVGKLVAESEVALRERVKREFDIDFNPHSHTQLKDLFWNRMKLTPPEWAQDTASGLPSTDSEVLEYLAKRGNDICKDLLTLSGLSKLHGTYLKPLRERGQSNAGLIRTSYNTVGPVTGRVSSSAPNLQNVPNADKMPTIPVDTLGKMYGQRMNGVLPLGWSYVGDDKKEVRMVPLRRAFCAPPGYKLLVADYSQIELRAIAHISGDPVLLNAYRHWDCICGASGDTEVAMHACPKCGAPDGTRDVLDPKQPVVSGFCLGFDIHSLTGLRLGLFAKLGPKKGRKMAKPVNFGLCYGESVYRLARDLGVSDDEAQGYHNGYFSLYAGVGEYHRWAIETLKTVGEFSMISSGRKRHFHVQKKAIGKNRFSKKDIAKTMRDIVNNLPQGSSADVMKKGVLTFVSRVKEAPELADCQLALQVHDEVVALVPEEVAENAKSVLVPALELSSRWKVPILVDCKICSSWDEK